MTALRRGVPVLAAMTVAMTFSSCVLRARGRTAAIDLVGLLFAVGVWLALVATRRWHGVSGKRTMIFPAVFVVAISFPLLRHGTTFVGIALATVLGSSASMLFVIYASMMMTSAAGARLVAAGMSWTTGRSDRLLRRMMAAWGAAWPLVTSPLGTFPPLDQGSLLAWHLPIGLACAAWVLRSPRQVVMLPAA